MQIDSHADILGLIDIQPTFMPGGELAVAEGDKIIPVVNGLLGRFEHAFATQDWHPVDHASFASMHEGRRPYDSIDTPHGSQVLWPDHAVAGSANAALHPAIEQTRIEVIIRKGFRRSLDSYSAFFENDRRTPTWAGGLAAAARVLPAVPVRLGHRLLRGLVGRGRRQVGVCGVHHRGCLPRHRDA